MCESKEKDEIKKPKNDIKKPSDFSHIKGDVDDFIFSFTDNKRHSEK